MGAAPPDGLALITGFLDPEQQQALVLAAETQYLFKPPMNQVCSIGSAAVAQSVRCQAMSFGTLPPWASTIAEVNANVASLVHNQWAAAVYRAFCSRVL